MIGSALAADVVIYASDEVQPLLLRLKDELRFVLISASAQVLPASACPMDVTWHETLGVAITVGASKQPKCVRCWHRCADIGGDTAHPELCTRCVGNLGAHPELRSFA